MSWLARVLASWVLRGAVLGMLCCVNDCVLGQNILPDPGFEATGEPGTARSGQRAGHLAVSAKTHWGALGGRIEVEPFARYRVTCWVKGTIRDGTFYAPYCYEWDSYEWAFVSAVPVSGTVGAWTKTETTFVSPYRTMYVHPIAYIDAANSEAWVDDVVVEKIADPEVVMSEIRSNAARNETETRLLVRWLVARGKLREAENLLAGTDGLLRADIATVLAVAARDPADRARFGAQAVAYGGPTYYEGVTRFRQMTAGFDESQKARVVLSGVRLNPRYERCLRSAAMLISDMAVTAGPSTLAERRRRVRVLLRLMEDIMSTVPRDTEGREALEEQRVKLNRQMAELDAEQTQLGKCVLVIGGKRVTPGSHVIVLPQKPSDVERYAARELQHHLELVTGNVLPIVSEGERTSQPGFYIGRCRKHREPNARLAQEELHIRAVGPDVAFTGAGRGVLYAVYTFLEDYLGCRWFTPECRTWQRSGRITIGKLDRRYRPPLEYRGGDYPVARSGEFAARLRLNGANHAIGREQGGNVGVHSLAHTFAALCPPERYYAEHPEYFALVNGKRHSGYAQLCLTNPDVLKIVIEGVRRWIRENPHLTVFSVSQNDTFNYCECPRCTAVAEEEGSQAGPLLRFVNAVADAIAKDHPNIAIETLAYQYTRKPPKVTKPRPNVIICLCSIECCFAHPLETDPHNASFVEDIKGWSRICKRLWIWDYVINYAHSICPFPNLYVLKPNIRFFIANGVRGIYEESCYFTRGSEFQELRNYIIAKTLWDPGYDTDRAIREFCEAFYGPATPHIMEYIRLIHDAPAGDPSRHVMIYSHPRDYITPDVLARARILFDRAEAAVRDDPVRLRRVQAARLPIIYCEIVLAEPGRWIERDGKLVQEGGTHIAALAEQFARTARAEGVTMIREGGPDAQLDSWLQTLPSMPRELEILTLGGQELQADILPEVGGRIWRLRARDGRDVLAVEGSGQGWEPERHGYEEYSEAGYRSPGWREAFAVKERSARHVVLEATLSNGLTLSRRIEVDPTEAVLRMTSTLANGTATPRKACLRSHPAFALEAVPEATVRVRRADGTYRDVRIADAGRETDVWLRGDQMPAGEWTVTDGATGLQVTCTFEPSQIAQCLLNWSQEERRINLEMFSVERELQPGDRIVVTQAWRVQLRRQTR